MAIKQQVMALNPARKGNMGRLNSSQPLYVYDTLIAQPWLKGVIAQIRGEKAIPGVDAGDEKAVKKAREGLKRQLPIRAIHYSKFRNNHRSSEDAVPESFLFQTTIDVDDVDYVDAALEKARELNCSNTIWKGKLLHLEYSARKKLHIDIRMPMGMTIEETQKAYCEAAGIPYDKSCITPERIIFITDKDSEIYRSKEWYGLLPDEEIKARREAFLKRGLTIDGRGTARYSLLAGDCKSPERLAGDFQGQVPSDSNHKVQNSILKVQSNGVQSSNLKVQSEDNVQDNRFQGTDSHSAVSSGAAIQPAQPGNSHRADDADISYTGGSQKAGGLAAQEAAQADAAGQAAGSACGVGLADAKNLIAFDLFQNSAGLKGMNIDTVGSRHSSLLAIMSAGASRVMSEEELMKVVAKRMPSYYQENDCHQLIHDFYSKYGDSSKPFSRDVIRVNALAEQAAKSLLAGDCKSPERLSGDFLAGQYGYSSLAGDCKSPERLAGNHKVQSSMFQVQSNACVQSTEEEDYPAPPPMPKKLPKLVELLISKTPEIYQPAVACAIFPPLATHLWRTSFRYIDNVEHEATQASVLLAGTGAGKSCVQKPIDFIMEDIRKRDAENLKREKEWKDEMMRKGANKDKRKRPENLIIQEIDADMTNPAFVMRTAEAKEHFLYTSLNEIDQFDALKGSGFQQFRIMCLAFDPGNLYGQTRVGTQSVTERVTIRFNWNASTTIHKGIRYFKRVLTDGPVSRINFCTIPERDIGEDIPVYGTYDEEFRNSLKPYIDNLCMASGLVECKEAFHLAEVLKDENAEFSRLSQDRVYENLSFRANVIGYLKACVLYVANGYQWEPEIEDFIRWSERYDLYCKMRFFGDAIKKAERDGDQESKKGPASILAFLPDKFSYQQVENLRLKNDMNAKGTAKMLRNWLRRGYIEKEESDSVTQKLSDSVYFKTHY